MSDSPAQHTIKSYDQDLRRLRDMIVQMGGLVENGVARATEAVLLRDPEAAMTVVEQDPRVDELEREAEQFVIKLIALRQPLADDLRHIFSALKVTDDLERVGDYAANIAKRSMALNQTTMSSTNSGIANMARLVQEALRKVIDAFAEDDAEKAMEVWRDDEAIDNIYNAIFRELITYMMEDPRNITACAHLLFVAKNYERIGDHATNIAETVYYAVTGKAVGEARPKGDSTPYATLPSKAS
jgi:phosphate transport system protein